MNFIHLLVPRRRLLGSCRSAVLRTPAFSTSAFPRVRIPEKQNGSKKAPQGVLSLRLAEKEGFEPSRRFPDKRISSAPRYDHFDTSPCLH